MDISSIAGLVPQSSLSGATTTSATDEMGKDTFLKLLTTQMQYQDPLNPMSNEQFVAQLAQFSSLEQLQGLTSGMESLYLVNVSMNNAAMTNLIGKDLVASGNAIQYGGSGSANLNYNATADAAAATVTVTNSEGQVVYTGDMGALSEGEGVWSWDGKDLDGQTVPEGEYTFEIAATDANGAEIAVDGRIVGTVSGMDLSSGSPLLTVNGVTIELGAILSVEEETP